MPEKQTIVHGMLSLIMDLPATYWYFLVSPRSLHDSFLINHELVLKTIEKMEDYNTDSIEGTYPFIYLLQVTEGSRFKRKSVCIDMTLSRGKRDEISGDVKLVTPKTFQTEFLI